MHRIGIFFFKKICIIIFFIIIILFFFSNPCIKSILFSIPFIISGEAIRIYSLRYSGGFTRSRELNAPSLVKEGPYSITRNPLYLGNLLNLFGVLLAMWLPLIIFILSFLILFIIYLLIIISEEKFLEDRFGDKYREYKKNVPRLLINPFKFIKTKPVNKYPKVFRIERDTIISILLFYLVMVIMLWRRGF